MTEYRTLTTGSQYRPLLLLIPTVQWSKRYTVVFIATVQRSRLRQNNSEASLLSKVTH